MRVKSMMVKALFEIIIRIKKKEIRVIYTIES